MQSESLNSPVSLTHIGQGDGVYISTYGCQMNENDSERMMTLLEMMNFRPVTSPDQASLIIINSCSIREKPVHKVHSEVGRYRKMKQVNPKLKIGVAGCVAQQEKEKLKLDIPLIDFVVGTDAIDQLPEVVAKVRDGQGVIRARFEHAQPYHIETMIRNPGVSTFVNITKGCDNFCTFCVVPFTRGRERSRPLKHLIDDVNKLVDRGVKEVTLLGQNVNSYESECGTNFAQLLKAVATRTGIERIRYTTSHPKDFNSELIEIMAEHRDKIMDYIHLPVQSGNSDVLNRMNRGYTREMYLEKAREIFEKIPGVVLSTDIITGFPGETDAQFEDTMTLMEEVPYENIFAFAYSARPMTKAARFPDQVAEEVKFERLNRLLARHREIAFSLAKKYENQTLKVLVERFDPENGKLQGRSTQNKSVHFTGDARWIGQTVDVRVEESFPLTLRGEMVQ
ncbi:MAG TPA: tRNA (N6-isopentenyl adenosine(37)-C2)-methylthiotransferase MiaB [Bdellovibrionales bacterium]|nr:tRNA (N6-isopentenyl adenosine(37)-C2)-methylthiotransferase MiaB [Bdellovibrionales bacterium]